MLETLNAQPQDKILALIALFRDDPRTTKIDLGVGVYKDATGLTPVMRAVKAAEKQLWAVETSKTYTGLAGEPAYNAALVSMILGGGYADRAASVATPGGTGAIRQALELIAADEVIDHEFRTILRNLITFMMEDPRTISSALDTLWVAKAIERIGDHAKNIAEYVIYMVKGLNVRHATLEEIDREIANS